MSACIYITESYFPTPPMHCLEKYDIIGQDYLSLARSAEVQGQRNLERERKRETEQQYREEEKKHNKEKKEK